MYEIQTDEPDPPKKLSVSRPLIGMAISVCVWVVSVMIGFFAICGSGNGGFNRGSSAPNPLAWFAIFCFFGSILCGIGCFIWFIIVMIMNYNRD